MKKHMIITAVMLGLCLTSCGTDDESDYSSSKKTPRAATTEEAVTESTTEQPTTEAETTESVTTEPETEPDTTEARTTEAETNESSSKTEPSGALEIKNAYKSVLEGFAAEADNIDDCAWDLQDLDSDGIPELLISEGTYHAAGVSFYYYANGSASPVMDENGEQYRCGAYGSVLVCPEKQLAACADIHMGYCFAGMDKYENHSFAKVVTFSDNSGNVTDGGEIEYTVNDEKVSEAEYNKVSSEFDAINWTMAGMQYKFSDLSALDDLD